MYADPVSKTRMMYLWMDEARDNTWQAIGERNNENQNRKNHDGTNFIMGAGWVAAVRWPLVFLWETGNMVLTQIDYGHLSEIVSKK